MEASLGLSCMGFGIEILCTPFIYFFEILPSVVPLESRLPLQHRRMYAPNTGLIVIHIYGWRALQIYACNTGNICYSSLEHDE